MARLPNVNISTDPSFSKTSSIRFVIKLDERKAARVKVFLKDFPNEVELGYRIGAEEFARKLHRLVVRCLKTGTPPKGVSWPPHSPVTTKMLGAHPLLNLTGFYMRSITIINKGWSKGVIAVGLPAGLRRPSNIKGSSSMTMRKIAEINEYGGGKVPPRPLWRPAYKQIGGNQALKKSVSKWVRKIIREEVIRCNMVSTTMKYFSVSSLGPDIRGYKGFNDAPLPKVDDLPF